MNAKEYLSQTYHLDMKINADIEELEMLRSSFMSPKSADPSGIRVQSGPKSQAYFAAGYERIAQLEEMINAEVDRYIYLREQIRAVIEAVENIDERIVLKYRYINHMSWDQTAAAMHVARSTVFRRHHDALLHVKVPADGEQADIFR